MRLVCPNCGAQYEVDDRVIPDSGRDVQCSSCGHAWYQMPANADSGEDLAPAETEEAIGADDDTTDFEPEPEAETAPAPETGPADAPDSIAESEAAAVQPDEAPSEPEPEPEPESEPTPSAPEATPDGAQETEEGAPATGPDGKPLPRRELDQNLRAILQEEVAREMAARAGDTDRDAGATPSEPDPTQTPEDTPEDADIPPAPEAEPSKGLTMDGPPEIAPAPAKDADVEVFSEAPAGATAEAEPDKKSLFPDIEEINSTLDSHGPSEDYAEEVIPEGRSGFGRGFFAIIFIAALAFALYLVAPSLAKSIPALEPVLSGYVGAVNGARGFLESLLQGVTNQIDSADQP